MALRIEVPQTAIPLPLLGITSAV
ncbi:MAG: hypothetical protein QOD01_839, partial [Actinomycetota bacterium]|nr:hypothetical protein [Actinomycetota bacterium]